jgi:hypothetical protein
MKWGNPCKPYLIELFPLPTGMKRRIRRQEIQRFAEELGGSDRELDPEWQESNESRLRDS